MGGFLELDFFFGKSNIIIELYDLAKKKNELYEFFKVVNYDKNLRINRAKNFI